MTNETDRELLELAAKAAEIPFDSIGATGCRVPIIGNESGYFWIPLTDDGDALTLEIKLKLDVTYNHADEMWVISGRVNGCFRLLAFNLDRKRASTMAAAEIGRTM